MDIEIECRLCGDKIEILQDKHRFYIEHFKHHSIGKWPYHNITVGESNRDALIIIISESFSSNFKIILPEIAR